MADRVCTRFIDNDGLDIGCHLVSKEYVLEAYPELVPWMNAPALWAWGNGLNMGNLSPFVNRSSPVQTISNGTNWKQVSAGNLFSAAIKTDGTLWLWGNNNNGVLGNNSSLPTSSPVQTFSGGTNWKSVSISSGHTTAIKTDGTLWIWGTNFGGILGLNLSTGYRSAPVQTFSGGTNWKTVSAGQTHTAAIKIDGTLWTWGQGYAGKLGDNSYVNRSAPVQTTSGGTNWSSVSAGIAHTAAIKNDGTLWTWGANTYGQLGNQTIISRSTPIQTITGGTNWKSVSAGGGTTASIKNDGTLWTWGSNAYGQLGNQTIISRSTPIQTITGGTNWRSISASSGNSLDTSIAAIKTDGSLWLWGRGLNGSFGDNANIQRSSPVQTISAGTNWKSVSISGTAAVAIRDEGDF